MIPVAKYMLVGLVDRGDDPERWETLAFFDDLVGAVRAKEALDREFVRRRWGDRLVSDVKILRVEEWVD